MIDSREKYLLSLSSFIRHKYNSQGVWFQLNMGFLRIIKISVQLIFLFCSYFFQIDVTE